jgi:protocatechuate 3,4-dioxygenase beta subunit
VFRKSIYCVLFICFASITFAADPEKPLVGRVVDEKDQPLAGAKIVAWGEKRGFDSIQELATTTSDSEGRFRFDEPIRGQTEVILASKEGKAIDWSYLAILRNAELTFHLGPAASIEGLAVNEEGKPIAEATVAAILQPQTLYLSRSLSQGCLRTKTDSQGRFRFDNLPSDVKGGFGINACGFADVFVASLFSPGQKGLRFVLPPEGKMEGLVVEKGTNTPLANVWIGVLGHTISASDFKRAKTDDKGQFRLDGLSGEKYTFEIIGSDAETPPEWIIANEKKEFSPLGNEFEIQAKVGKVVSGVKVEAIKGGLVEIILNDANTGKPIVFNHANVTVCPEKDLRVTTMMYAKSGRLVKMYVSPDTYVVTSVETPGYRFPVKKSKPFQVEVDQPNRVSIDLQPAQQVTSTVCDYRGHTVPDAKIQVIPMVGPSHDILSGKDGQFSIGSEDIQPVFCFLLVRHPKENLMAIGAISMDEPVPQIVLAPPAKISGVVVDPQHHPIAGAQIQAQISASHFGRYGLIASTKTDENGRYQIELVGSGMDYVISAKAPGYVGSEITVSALVLPSIQLPQPVEGQKTEAISTEQLESLLPDSYKNIAVEEMVLSPANRSIHCVVKDSKGNPVPGAVVAARLSRTRSLLGAAITDAQGQCTLEHLENSKSISLSAEVPGRGWSNMMDTIEPDQQAVEIKVAPSMRIY